ncbi:glycosyltransferase [Sphingomonas sp. GM_Shp_2]|uniref:glycosyltransferase n=1 Tax=Sphingomonas sp. GM_Shp_2 TaxID=2937380 RepID=UPI00226989F2|nr:glycosyltransferase [Sphingomonas sp. GM_Shp_2]
MTCTSVAVLLATYNGAAHCETQLISLLWQRGVDVHIYVRDDGSRDATPAILRDWAERHPGRFTIIDNEGVSTGSANGNFFALLAAIDTARHDYVAFADQDDVWTPDKLARAVKRLVEEGAEGYSSDLIAYSAAAEPTAAHAWILHKAGRPADLDYLFQGASAGCTYVLTRHAAAMAQAVMATAPAFCADPSHDWILYAICRSRGLKWVRDPAAEILYRQHDGNQYGAKRGPAELAAKLRVMRSSWYRDHILWLRHVLINSDSERAVLDAVARGALSDRWRLIREAGRFRRTPAYVAQLRAAIVLRMI